MPLEISKERLLNFQFMKECSISINKRTGQNIQIESKDSIAGLTSNFLYIDSTIETNTAIYAPTYCP